jgi:YjbE family integral membrane protein
MEMLGSSFFWVTLAQIMMINIVLSGDNAVVIAMASRALPPRQQKQAILFGSFGAIALRVILTFFAVMLLGLPYIKIIGSALLGWIGIKMLVPDEAETELDGHSHLWAAIKTIIVADFVMSLDNVLGVAAAAKGNLVLLILGLAISIPLIIYGSTLILKLMNRFPIIITLGGGILGWVAGEMLVTDPVLGNWVENRHWLHTVVPVLAVVLVIGGGKFLAMSNSGALKKFFTRAEPAAGEEAPPGYHWVSRTWRRLPDGTRDYAAYYGKTAFKFLMPLSGRLRSRKTRSAR